MQGPSSCLPGCSGRVGICRPLQLLPGCELGVVTSRASRLPFAKLLGAATPATPTTPPYLLCHCLPGQNPLFVSSHFLTCTCDSFAILRRNATPSPKPFSFDSSFRDRKMEQFRGLISGRGSAGNAAPGSVRHPPSMGTATVGDSC